MPEGLVDPRTFPVLKRIITIRNESDYTFTFDIGSVADRVFHFIGNDFIALDAFSGVQLGMVTHINLQSFAQNNLTAIEQDYIPWFLALQIGDTIEQTSDDYPDLNTLYRVAYPGITTFSDDSLSDTDKDWLYIPVTAVTPSDSATVRSLGGYNPLFMTGVDPYFYLKMQLHYQSDTSLPESIDVWAEASELGSEAGVIESTADSSQSVPVEVSIREYSIRGDYAGVVRPGSIILDAGRAWTVRSVQGDALYRFITLTAESQTPQRPMIQHDVRLNRGGL